MILKKVKLGKPRVYTKGHLLGNVDYRKVYAASKGHAGWIKIVDDTGQTVHLSKTVQREHFVEVPDGSDQQ